MERRTFLVVAVFDITNRGTVVVFDGPVEVASGAPIPITISLPDGTAFDTVAFHEWLLRRVPVVHEQSAMLLPNVARHAVPTGSILTIR